MHSRSARVHHFDPDSGLATLEVRGDLPDLLDFDATLSEVAAKLADLDPETLSAHGVNPEGRGDTLQVRRTRAVGILADPARAQALLDIEPTPPEVADTEAPPQRPRRPRSRRPRRQVVLHVHLAEDALRGQEVVGRLERGSGTGVPVLEETVREWCGHPDTSVRVLPVLDQSDHRQLGAYEIPDRFKTDPPLDRPPDRWSGCHRLDPPPDDG